MVVQLLPTLPPRGGHEHGLREVPELRPDAPHPRRAGGPLGAALLHQGTNAAPRTATETHLPSAP